MGENGWEKTQMETEKKRLTAKKDGKDRNGIQIRKVEECQEEMSMTRDRARGRETHY